MSRTNGAGTRPGPRPGARWGRPNDPERAERIRAAALDLVVEDGVRAVTYRRVAERAGVPLGSVSYYYPDTDALLDAVFDLMVERVDPGYADALEAAPDGEAAVEVLVGFVRGDQRPDEAALRLQWELYCYGTRHERVARRWASYRDSCVAAVARRFGPMAATVDALIEGWWAQEYWQGRIVDEATMRAVLTGFLPGTESGPGPGSRSGGRPGTLPGAEADR